MKTISVPRTPEAAARLNLGVEQDGDLIELSLSAEQFSSIFESGWVREINEAAGCLIDDYEDTHIDEPNSIRKAAAITSQYSKNYGGIFFQIVGLLEEAEQRQTGLHFYF